MSLGVWLRIVHLAAILLLVTPLAAGGVASSEQRDFQVKFGIMERATASTDRLRETGTITMDPTRRPGWCFVVDPPNEEPYKVYSVHHLPLPPENLTGNFVEDAPIEATNGIRTLTQRVDGIRPFCFDFHRGDPLGEYRVQIFINGTLKTTLRVNVVASDSKDGADE